MRVAVVGAGTAGLYFSFLQKRNHPRCEIRIFERRLASERPGWGISLPSWFLDRLQHDEPESYQALHPHLMRWNTLEIRWKGLATLGQGPRFASVARSRLLSTLEGLVHEVGVRIEYGCRVSSVSKLLEEYDLVIGADGAHARSRDGLITQLGARVESGKNYFLWLGTDRFFEAFRFVFEENENRNGFFIGYIYPFAPGWSTVVVECDPASFHSTGLSADDQQGWLNYLERIFASHLEGGRLVSKGKFLWSRFPLVLNTHLVHGNLVLLGDAAHTAHYSIGEGTRLAIEDAIVLAGYLRNQDIHRALMQYEATRPGYLARWLRMANNSRLFFENLHALRSESHRGFVQRLLARKRA